MSKLLYIHKPSLTAIVQYNPHPTQTLTNMPRVDTVDIVTVASYIYNSETYPQAQKEVALTKLIKTLVEKESVTPTNFVSATDFALWFVINHPQHLVEGN